MNIEVFADLWCPFTHVGLRAVAEQRRLTGRTDVGIIVRAWPLELVNGHPMDPAGARQHADELIEQVAPTLFAGLDVEHFPTTTLPALALVERAYRSSVAAGERASFVLRDALFEEGQDISDADVLAHIAGELGVGLPDAADHDAIRSDWDEGKRRGVQGSPHFFAGNTNVFCPSLRISREAPDAALTIRLDTSRLMAFLEQAFAR